MTSTFLTSPLDVVKTRLQSDFYKQQLAAKKNLHTGGLIRQGARHFQETFQILALAPPSSAVGCGKNRELTQRVPAAETYTESKAGKLSSRAWVRTSAESSQQGTSPPFPPSLRKREKN